MTKFTQEAMVAMLSDFKRFIPQLSINCVIFRFNGQELQVPIVQPIQDEIWVIPGGFVYQDEDIDDAAKRILYEQTQIDLPILGQFGTYGPADRNFASELSAFKNSILPSDIIDWISQRFVTIGYYSILNRQPVDLKTGPLFKNGRWVNVKETDTLALDHSLLVSEARKVLGSELLSKPLLLSFMPPTFTIPELQKLYEAILDRPIDRGNFRQRILKSDILTKVGVSKEKTKSRPPILYSLDEQRYLNSLTQNIKLGF
ncbi:NUDIX domain-containing protein [Flavobacteriaceae bacterium 3-367]|uniref:NUDIX hydrolase n=1 Tax=Eudoraea algarum TaxID=3417568 RepID=UPI00326C6716